MVHWMIIGSWPGSFSTATPQSLPLACPQLWFCLADLYGTASQYPPKPAYSTAQGCPQCGMTRGAPVRRRWGCGLVSRQIPAAPTRTPYPHWSPNPGCWSRTNAALTQPNGTGLAAWSRRCPMTNTWSDWMDQVASQSATGNTSNTSPHSPRTQWVGLLDHCSLPLPWGPMWTPFSPPAKVRKGPNMYTTPIPPARQARPPNHVLWVPPCHPQTMPYPTCQIQPWPQPGRQWLPTTLTTLRPPWVRHHLQPPRPPVLSVIEDHPHGLKTMWPHK